MTRPLLIIFLTIFVNLVGFGIIIPLLPFYAQTFGASPFVIGLLFASFSLAQLIASPVLGGLSGGNITTARAYIADVTPEEDRARAYGILGAAFGLGFIIGPALGAAFSHLSYTAPIWAAAAITLVATALAWVWLPETVHRA